MNQIRMCLRKLQRATLWLILRKIMKGNHNFREKLSPKLSVRVLKPLKALTVSPTPTEKTHLVEDEMDYRKGDTIVRDDQERSKNNIKWKDRFLS